MTGKPAKFHHLSTLSRIERRKMLALFALAGLFAAVTSASLVPTQEMNQSSSQRCPMTSGRMVNGDETTINAYPHQVSIHVAKIGLICGGSIISKYWIVTAAQCLLNEKHLYTIRAGSSYGYKRGSRHHAKRFVIHEYYDKTNEGTPENDIGLIRVKEKFHFDRTIKPIDLYRQNENFEIGELAHITGWGFTGCGYRDTLSVVKLPTITHGRCNFHYAYRHGISEHQICAVHEEGNRAPCRGDEGAPMTVNGRLAGIGSWSEGCARPDKPAVFTQVSYYYYWIKSHMRYIYDDEKETSND